VLGLLRQSRKKKRQKRASPRRIDGQIVEEKRGLSEIMRDSPVH
jgi:hypothetical protein